MLYVNRPRLASQRSRSGTFMIRLKRGDRRAQQWRRLVRTRAAREMTDVKPTWDSS